MEEGYGSGRGAYEIVSILGRMLSSSDDMVLTGQEMGYRSRYRSRYRRLLIATVLILGLARTSTMTARLIEMLEILAPTREWEFIRRHPDSSKHKKVLSTFDLLIDGYPKIDAKVVKRKIVMLLQKPSFFWSRTQEAQIF